MEKKVLTLESATDRLVLEANLYTPDKEPKCIVQIIHGMAEHKERYDVLAQVLANYGCVVLIADCRGHGKSINKNIPLGYFAKNNGWLVNLQDMHDFSLMIREKYRHLPFYLIGHSLGALIAHSYLKRYEDILDGVILSGMPAFNSECSSGKTLTAIMSKFGDKKTYRLLTNALDYNKNIVNPQTKFDWLSYNIDNVDEYIADPLCGYPYTVRGYYDMMEGMQDAFMRKDWRVLKKNLPILFIAGQDDPCADVGSGFKKSLNNLAKAGYNNIEANIYENMRNEVFNEREKKVVYKDILLWLNKQLAGSGKE